MIDAFTSLVVSSVGLLAMAVLVWSATRGRPSPAVAWWCAGSLLGGIGMAFYGAREVAPEFVGYHLTNTLAIFSGACWIQSLRGLLGSPLRSRTMAMIAILTLCAYSLLYFMDPMPRTWLSRAVLGSQQLAVAFHALTLARRVRSPNAVGLACAQGALGLILLGVSLLGVLGQYTPAPFASGISGAVSILASAVSHVCFVGLMLDIQAEQRLAALRHQAEAEEEARFEAEASQQERQRQGLLVLGSMAHELNQPLTVALTQAQIGQRRLKSGKAEPEVMQGTLETIEDALMRTSAILDRIRGASSSATRPPQPFDLRDVARDALALMAPDWAGKNISIWDGVSQGEPAPCEGDPIAVCQVLVNLLRNSTRATQATPDGRIEVRCEVNGDEACVSVRDHGPGVPEGVLANLGEAFIAQSSNGLGLGLAICKAIAKEQQARFELANCDGGGALAVFAMPLRAEAVA